LGRVAFRIAFLRSIIGAHRIVVTTELGLGFKLVGDCFVHRWTVRWEIVECLVVADNTTFTMNRLDGWQYTSPLWQDRHYILRWQHINRHI